MTNQVRDGIVDDLVKFALIALLIVIPVRIFIAQPFVVRGASMEPTFHGGEYLIVDQLSYRLGDPERGDVIILRYPKDESVYFIKRVIGLPGDRVELVDKQLLINGRPTEDPHGSYSLSGSMRQYGPVTVPADHLFVMGDNRDESSDSRVWGFVPRHYLKGKAFLIYWSWDRKSYGVRWSRLADIVR